jgi:hypothetical protein
MSKEKEDAKEVSLKKPTVDKVDLPPGEEDLIVRVEGMIKEVSPILEKYELGIIATPKVLDDGRLGADPTFASTRKHLKEPEKPLPAEAAPVNNGIVNPDA